MLNSIRLIPPHFRMLTAIAFLTAACVTASLKYTYSFLWFFNREISFLPDLVSGLVAIFLLLPIIRGDFLYEHRIGFLTAINLVLIFYLTAAFANIGLGGDLSFAKAPTTVFTLLVIMLANYNPARYGELAILALAIFGGLNLYAASKAMGFQGFLLALFSFIGVILSVDLQKVTMNLRQQRQ